MLQNLEHGCFVTCIRKAQMTAMSPVVTRTLLLDKSISIISITFTKTTKRQTTTATREDKTDKDVAIPSSDTPPQAISSTMLCGQQRAK